MENLTAFPPSFGNNPFLYATSLGSITALSFLMAMVAGWMARDLWRDRYHVHPNTALTAFRVIIMVAAGTSCMRALPEAIFMYSWNEISERNKELVLTMKRFADSVAIAPGVFWTASLVLAYPRIAAALKADSRTEGADIWSGWPNMVRPLLALVLIFMIAFLVSMSKLYLGIPDR
jgi:hypothetical protein